MQNANGKCGERGGVISGCSSLFVLCSCQILFKGQTIGLIIATTAKIARAGVKV